MNTDESNIILLGNRNGHINTDIKPLKHVIGKVVKNQQLWYLDNDSRVTRFIRYFRDYQ